MVGWPVGGGVEVVGLLGKGGAEVVVACGEEVVRKAWAIGGVGAYHRSWNHLIYNLHHPQPCYPPPESPCLPLAGGQPLHHAVVSERMVMA